MKKVFLLAVEIYQKYVSLVLPRACRFWPSCSCYARESIERYGALKGGFKSMRRIIRCHPFSTGGYDPVK